MKSLRQETTNTEDVSKDGKSPSKDAVSGRGKVVGLFHLPEEVQELILVYLDVRDLVACAQVCRIWRIGINSSWIWKKWCVLESYKPELLEQCPTHLFVDNGEDSVGMGYWRRVYGWHEKLRYNWKTKSLNRYKLSQSTSHVYCFDTNGEVAATGHEDASVTVWSIKSVPFVIASFRGVLHDFPILCVKVDKNLVVVQQRKVLQVFYCAHQKYQLTDLKTFEMGEENIDQMEFYSEHESRFCSWYEECLRAFDKTSAPPTLVFNVFRNLLYTSSHHSSLVRVWTLPGSEICMSIEARPEVFQIVADESNVYFVTRDEVTYFLKYEEKTQSAVPQLSVPGLKKIILGHELVVALPSPGDVTLKRIWVYKKGFYSRPLGTRTITGYSVVSLCPPHYVVYSEDMQVSVWDPVTKRTVSHFGTGAMVTFLRPAFSSFLLVFMGTSLHLWDWKTGERLYRLYSGLEWTGNYGNLLWANASSILSGGVDHQLEMISFM